MRRPDDKKVFVTVFGGILVTTITPIAYWLIFRSMPLEVFYFLFEVLLELSDVSRNATPPIQFRHF
jgi:hypothetical protein